MNCEETRDAILDLNMNHAALEHLHDCEECRHFQSVQQRLDTELAQALTPPLLSPSFDHKLRDRVRREKRQALWNWLPGALGSASGMATAGFCAWLVPTLAPAMLGAGVLLSALAFLGPMAFEWFAEELDG
jgi:predicted anti-sigma-YlaC factor YlaD